MDCSQAQGYSSDRTHGGQEAEPLVSAVSPPIAKEHVPVASSASVEAEDGLVEVDYSGSDELPLLKQMTVLWRT